jgi:glutamate-1-semialdehyde aminotransferase
MFSFLLENGIFMLLPETLHGAISNAHTDDEIERLVSTIERFVKGRR